MGLTQSEHRFASTVVSHHPIDLFLASACTIPLVLLFIATVAAPPLIGTGRGPQEWVCNPDIIASAPLLAWFTNKHIFVLLLALFSFFMSLSLFALWTSSTAERSLDAVGDSEGGGSVMAVAEDMLVLHLLLLLPVAEHCNPVLGYGVSKNANYQFQRRPESKSGSIVPPGSAVYSTGSPLMQLLDDGGSGSVRN